METDIGGIGGIENRNLGGIPAFPGTEAAPATDAPGGEVGVTKQADMLPLRQYPKKGTKEFSELSYFDQQRAMRLDSWRQDLASGTVDDANAMLEGVLHDPKLAEIDDRERKFREVYARAAGQDVSKMDDDEAQALYMGIVEADPRLGLEDDFDGSKLFGEEAEYGRGNLKRLMDVYSGINPHGLLSKAAQEWFESDDAEKLRIAKDKFGAMGSVGVTGSSVTGAVFTPVYERHSDAEIVEKYERDLLANERTVLYASLMSTLPKESQDVVKTALRNGELTDELMSLVPDGDEESVMAAFKAANPKVDANWWATQGALKALEQTTGLAGGAWHQLKNLYLTTGGRAPIGSAKLRDIEEREKLRIQLRNANAMQFKELTPLGTVAAEVIGNLPFMAAYSNPYTAMVANLGIANDAREKMIEAGVDQNLALGASFVIGAVEAKIEKLQWEGVFGSGLSEFALRRANIARIGKLFAKGDFKSAFSKLGTMGREGFVTTVTETAEEVLQGMSEDLGVEFGLHGADVGDYDTAKIVNSMVDTAIESFPATVGFGFIRASGIGPALRARLSNQARTVQRDFGEFLNSLNLARNAIDGVEGLGERVLGERMARVKTESDPVSAFVEELSAKWERIESADDRMDMLLDAGLTADQAALLNDAFEAREEVFEHDIKLEDGARKWDVMKVADLMQGVADAVDNGDGTYSLKVDIGADQPVEVTVSGKSRNELLDVDRAQVEKQVSGNWNKEHGEGAWNALSDDERDLVLRAKMRANGITVHVGDAAVPLRYAIYMANGNAVDDVGGTNRELAHEIFHVATLAAKRAGIITDGDTASLREMFGGREGYYWDEEKAADLYGAWLLGKHADESGVFGKIRKFFGSILERLGIAKPERAEGDERIEKLFDAIERGDLRQAAERAGLSGGTYGRQTKDGDDNITIDHKWMDGEKRFSVSGVVERRTTRLAPNGRRSNLTDRQYEQVRTPEFKAWFGDWEYLAGVSFKGMTLSEANEAIASLGKTPIKNKGTGITMTLSSAAIRKLVSNAAMYKSRDNGFTAMQHNAIAANIARLFEDASLVSSRPDKDGDVNILSIKRMASPVVVDKIPAVAWITIKESKQHGSHIYSVEGIKLEAFNRKIEEEIKLAPHALNASVGDIISKFRDLVNGVSKVVDENGEPMVVYHRTDWNPIGEPDGKAVFAPDGAGTYFTSKLDETGYYGKNIVSAFINLRNPRLYNIETDEPIDKHRMDDFQDLESLYAPELKARGFDGAMTLGVVEAKENWFFVNDSTQIKSATDNVGTFDATDPDIRYSLADVTAEDRAAYEDAMFDGDDERAVGILRNVAGRVMPDTKVVGEDGKPKIVYHHTENAFTEFDLDKARKSMDIQGFFFYDNPTAGEEYGSRNYGVFLNITNPYVIDSAEKMAALNWDWSKDGEGIRVRDELMAQGYDGVVRTAEFMGDVADEWIAFKPEQIKLAEPTYRDEWGDDPIGLDERFDSSTADIRYSLAPADYEPKQTYHDITGKYLYKTMRVVDGHLEYPMAGTGVEVPVGKWLEAEDMSAINPKTGKRETKLSFGSSKVSKKTGKVLRNSGTAAPFAGFHMGSIPYMAHIGLGGDAAQKHFQNADYVWVAVDVPMDRTEEYRERTNDYANEDAMRGVIPEDGIYFRKTNPNMKGKWGVAGQMKIVEVLSDDRVDEILDREAPDRVRMGRQGGGRFNAETMQFEGQDLANWNLADAEKDFADSNTRHSLAEPSGVQKQSGTAYPDASEEVREMGEVKAADATRYSFKEDAKALILKKRPDVRRVYSPAYDEWQKLTGKDGHKAENWEEFRAWSREKDREYGAEYAVSEIMKFPDPKARKAALNWFIRGAIRLPEDAPKVTEVLQYAERAKGKANTDALTYESPMAMIVALHEFKPKAKPINPDKTPELSDRRDMGNGVVTYLVQDDRAGQRAMRQIINTHWGEDANPWCLLHGDGHGNLSDGSGGGYDAWHYWQHYSALPKRVAFLNGKLLAFMATDGGGDEDIEVTEEDAPDLVEQYRSDMAEAYEDDVSSYDSFNEWMDMEHSDRALDIRQLKAGQIEQWWDRKDFSHEGIPLGNIPIEGDAFGRWADFEIVNGKLTRTSGTFHRGDPNGFNYTTWRDNGFKEEESTGNVRSFEYKEWHPNGSLKIYKRSVDSGDRTYFLWGPDGRRRNDTVWDGKYTENDDIPQDAEAEARRIFAENDQRVPQTVRESSPDVRASISLDKDLMDAALKANNANGAVPLQVMMQALDDRRAIYRIFSDPEKSADLGLPPDEAGKTSVGNASYGMTMENSTICTRTLGYEELADLVAEWLDRPLSAAEALYVAQQAMNYTDKPQCLYCYVAMDRMGKREFYGKYIDQRDAVIKDIEAGVSVKKAYENFLAGRTDTRQMKNRFTMWVNLHKSGAHMIGKRDLASTKRMTEAAGVGDAERLQVRDAERYAQSAAWAKKKIDYHAYNGEILRWRQSLVDSMNRQFGLRFYSFSDYTAAFILENMQQITDASVRGLKGLGYTKELDFVDIFADTGMNINISTFGFEDTKTGEILCDGMQGADWEEAKKRRAMYDNVGITFVATNDRQVEWALSQDWIDTVIPYHLVRTGDKIAKFMGWTNYKSMQEDVKNGDWQKGDKKAIFPHEHNNDRDTYFRLLGENHLSPRFAKWVDNPNYMKLVNETRRSAKDTPAMQPVFDVDAATKSIETMRNRGGYFEHIGVHAEETDRIAKGIAENIEGGAQPSPADQFRPVAPQSRASVSPRTGDPTDVITAMVAARARQGKRMTVQDVQKLLSFAGRPTEGAADLLNRANRVAERLADVMKRKAVDSITPAMYMDAATAEARRDRLVSIAEQAGRAGYELGREDAELVGEMNRRKQAAVMAQIEAATGISAADMESTYGVDLVKSVQNATLASYNRGRPVRSDDPEDAPGEVNGEGLPIEVGEEAEAPEVEVSDAPLSAETKALVARAKARADRIDETYGLEGGMSPAQRRENEENNRIDEAEAELGEEDEATESPDGEGGEAEEKSAEIRRETLSFERASDFLAFVEEMVLAEMKRRGDRIGVEDPFKTSPVARRELANTAKHFLRKIASALTYSLDRERIQRDLDRLSDLSTLEAIETAIMNRYSRIQEKIIPQTQEKMVKTLKKEGDRLAKNGKRFTHRDEDRNRKVTGEVELWWRSVREYLDMSESEVEAEANALRQTINERLDETSKDSSYDIDQDLRFRRAVDKLNALTQYGGLVNRPVGEISDKAGEIVELLGGKFAEMQDAREETRIKLQTMSEALKRAVVNPESKRANKKPVPGWFSRMMDSMMGILSVRMRDLIRYSSGVERQRAEDVLRDVEDSIALASQNYNVYLVRQQREFEKVMARLYGSSQDGMRRLTEKLDDADRALVSKQGVGEMTRSWLLQRYVELLQGDDYALNIHTHGRNGRWREDFDRVFAKYIDDTDMSFLMWMRDWYRQNLADLNEKVLVPITGVKQYSPGEMYFPMKMKVPKRDGVDMKASGWSPLPSWLTPRVRNSYDFDEGADLVTMWYSRMREGAVTLAYSELGINLSHGLLNGELKEAVAANHGDVALRRLTEHVSDILSGGGREIVNSDDATALADRLRAWQTNLTLSCNYVSAIKQMVSTPTYALRHDITFGMVAKFMVDVDMGAVRELLASDGWTSRYGQGSSEAIANAMRNNGVAATGAGAKARDAIARLYNAGFKLMEFGDSVPCVWVGQGLYRYFCAQIRDKEGGLAVMTEEDIKRKAMTRTWAVIEMCQQSKRTENLTAAQRGGPLGRLLYQFVSSPVQQLSYEVQAVREAMAARGTPHSGEALKHMGRVLLINHVLIPNMLRLAAVVAMLPLGSIPDPEDEAWDALYNLVMGQFGCIFMAGAVGESTYNAVRTGKFDYRSNGLPIEGIVDIFQHLGITAHDLLTLDAEGLQNDLVNLIRDTGAVGRQAVRAWKNYTK